MQNLSGLRSLVALHIFYTKSDICNAILRELRSCAVDNILHYPMLRIEYVGMSSLGADPSYGVVTQLARRPHQSPKTARTPEPQRGLRGSRSRANSGYVSSHSSSSGSNTIYEDLGYVSGESESELDYVVGPLKVFETSGVALRDIFGIKIWEEGIWRLRL